MQDRARCAPCSTSAALQPEAERERRHRRVVAGADGGERDVPARDPRGADRRTRGRSSACRRAGKTAWASSPTVPTRERIMAEITRGRRASPPPSRCSSATAAARLGIGEAVAERLAVLDVNLPTPAQRGLVRLRARRRSSPATRRSRWPRTCVLYSAAVSSSTAAIWADDRHGHRRQGPDGKGPAVAHRRRSAGGARAGARDRRPRRREEGPGRRRPRRWATPSPTPTSSSSPAAPTRARRGPSPTRSSGGLRHASAAGARRGRARGRVDPSRLPRRRRARLHAGGARVLPPREPLGRRPARPARRGD